MTPHRRKRQRYLPVQHCAKRDNQCRSHHGFQPCGRHHPLDNATGLFSALPAGTLNASMFHAAPGAVKGAMQPTASSITRPPAIFITTGTAAARQQPSSSQRVCEQGCHQQSRFLCGVTAPAASKPVSSGKPDRAFGHPCGRVKIISDGVMQDSKCVTNVLACQMAMSEMMAGDAAPRPRWSPIIRRC